MTLFILKIPSYVWENEHHVQKVKLVSEKLIHVQDKCICKCDALNKILIACICIYFIHYENQGLNHEN